MTPMTEAWYEAMDPYVPGTCVSDVRLPYACDYPIRWGCDTTRAVLAEPWRPAWRWFWSFAHPRCAGYGAVTCEDGGHRSGITPELLAHNREHWGQSLEILRMIDVLWPGRMLLAALASERLPVQLVGRLVGRGDEDGVLLQTFVDAAGPRYRRFCYWPREQVRGQACLIFGTYAKDLTRDQLPPATDRCGKDLERRQCGVCASELFDQEVEP